MVVLEREGGTGQTGRVSRCRWWGNKFVYSVHIAIASALAHPFRSTGGVMIGDIFR